jgi:hypothetical protein
MTELETKISESLESWSYLHDFDDLVSHIAYWFEQNTMPDIHDWIRLVDDYDELVIVVNDLFYSIQSEK